ncbi:MAG TPA: glutaredoxin domain-containing protein, partial [Sphingomicrobium sp.]|nr:glutaredoxin domain-containing protein [Sphingomicrobium sp.]
MGAGRAPGRVDALTAAPKFRPEGEFVPLVEIYTKSFCGYCWRAKHLLESKGVAYREIAVDFGGAERQA